MSKKTRYPISVIIPTYNGKEKVIRLLNLLCSQSFKNFETIVVIDGSVDRTKEALDSYSFELINLKVIDQLNAGRAGARNTGASLATSPILLFLDDDMVPSDTLIQDHLKEQEENKIVVGILDSYDDGSNPEILAFSYYMNNKMNGTIFESKERDTDVFYITANNFSIRSNLFQQLNGFDSRLNDAEDFELAIRCKENGLPIHYSSKCLAYHTLVTSLVSGAKRNKEYKLGREELLKYHPGAEKYFNTSKTTLSPYKKPFFYLLSSKFWLILADKNAFKILPKAARFKLYDIFLTANFYF